MHIETTDRIWINANEYETDRIWIRDEYEDEFEETVVPEALNDKENKELTEKEIEDELEAINFPNEVMKGMAGEYARTSAKTYEAEAHTFFIAFCTLIGSLVSDQVMMNTAYNSQPRLFTVILGASGNTRKSTACRRTIDLIKGTESPELNSICLCKGVDSGQGLALKLEKIRDGNDLSKMIFFKDELKRLMDSGKIKASTILTVFSELFEDNDYEGNTLTYERDIRNAHVSLLAACTIRTYQASWNDTYLSLGLDNRFFICPTRGIRSKSYEPRIPKDKIDSFRQELIDICQFVVDNYNEPRMMVIDMTTPARLLYDLFYKELEEIDENKRIDSYSLRFMIILALIQRKTVVDEEVVRDVIKIMTWQSEMRVRYAPIEGANIYAKLENKIIRAAERFIAKFNRQYTKRELERAFTASREKRNCGEFIYNKVWKNLEKAGVIRYVSKPKRK